MLRQMLTFFFLLLLAACLVLFNATLIAETLPPVPPTAV